MITLTYSSVSDSCHYVNGPVFISNFDITVLAGVLAPNSVTKHMWER